MSPEGTVVSATTGDPEYHSLLITVFYCFACFRWEPEASMCSEVWRRILASQSCKCSVWRSSEVS